MSDVRDLLKLLGDRLPPFVIANVKEYDREIGPEFALESLTSYLYEEWVQLTPEEIAAIDPDDEYLRQLVAPGPNPEQIVRREWNACGFTRPIEAAAHIVEEHRESVPAVIAVLRAPSEALLGWLAAPHRPAATREEMGELAEWLEELTRSP